MGLRNFNFAARPIKSRRASAQFAFQVRPFEKQLAARFNQSIFACADYNLCPIEFVTSTIRFIRNFGEITGDRSCRRRRRSKSAKLRMASVASRASEQNLLRQQSFTPGRDQALWVEVLRVNRPEPHSRESRICFDSARTVIRTRPRCSLVTFAGLPSNRLAYLCRASHKYSSGNGNCLLSCCQ